MHSGRFRPLARVGIVIAIGLVLVSVPQAKGQTVAHDDASSTAYDSGWFNGQSSGTGFSNWTVQLPSGATAGVASSSDNDSFEPGHVNINTAGRALRLVSDNGAQAADGLRTFTGGAMQVGQVFTIWMDNGSIVAGGAVGFGLQSNANGNNRFELYFLGGDGNYSVNDSSSGHRDTGLPFTRGGLKLALLLTGTDTYRAHIVRDGSFSYISANNLITGSLTGTSGSGIDKLRVFNFKAGANTFQDAFFTNQFDISDGFTWDGGGSNDNVSTSGNWKLDVPPIRDQQLTMHFGGTTRLTPVLDASNFFVKNVFFDADAGPFVLGTSGAPLLTLFGQIVNQSPNVQTINTLIFVNAVTTLDTGSAAGGAVQVGSIDLGTSFRSLNWTGSNAGTISGVVTGSGSLAKAGSGLLHLSAGVTHIYSGVTAVTGGTLRVDATLGPLTPGTGTVSVGNGTANSGILAGSGIISRPVTINAGGTVSPGSGDAGSSNTISTLTMNGGELTLEGGGAYAIEIDRRADQGTEGVNWDKLTLSALTVNANSANRFVIRVVGLNSTLQPGGIQNWDPDVSQTWRVATVSGTVSGFDLDDFAIDLTQFTAQNAIKSVFYFWQSGTDLHLTYVPEPSISLLLPAVLAALLQRRSRGGRRIR